MKEAKSLGLQVLPWTVNDPPDMERLIDWGVDGIITDYPDRLRDVHGGEAPAAAEGDAGFALVAPRFDRVQSSLIPAFRITCPHFS